MPRNNILAGAGGGTILMPIKGSIPNVCWRAPRAGGTVRHRPI